MPEPLARRARPPREGPALPRRGADGPGL